MGRLHLTIVDAPGMGRQGAAARPEAADEIFFRPGGDVADSLHPQPGQAGRRLGADAPQLRDRQRGQEAGFLADRHDPDGVGRAVRLATGLHLAEVVGDLGDQLVGGRAERDRQVKAAVDRDLQAAGDGLRRIRQERHIQESLINRKLLNQGREVAQDGHDLR